MLKEELVLKDKLQEYKNIVDENLLKFIPDEAPKKLVKSMEYSLSAGGKRIRPILLLMVCDEYSIPRDISLPIAVSIEYIHTYSLIHDDLPAMDDDNYRRGKLTNHKVFGEAMAILAGDGLLTHAFSIVASIDSLDPNKKNKIIKLLSDFSGPTGMIKGQVLDMENEGKIVTEDKLIEIHNNKTGKLLLAPLLIASVLCDFTQKQLNGIKGYGKCLGLTFQITDDILDFCGNFEETGKPIGSDEQNNKATYVTIYGLNKARELALKYASQGSKYLEESQLVIPYLNKIINYLVDRKG